jgi:hypothetical protein
MVANTGEPAFYPDLTAVLRAATREYIRECEALAHDEIAAMMRRLEQRERREVRFVDVDDCEPLPFSDAREVQE